MILPFFFLVTAAIRLLELAGIAFGGKMILPFLFFFTGGFIAAD
jgi:hypothetical protein